MRIRHAVRVIFLATGAILIAVGLFLGEAREIISKAAVVCMECIGIG